MQTNKMKGNQVKIQQTSLNINTTTTTLESLQQEINQQELQVCINSIIKTLRSFRGLHIVFIYSQLSSKFKTR